MTKLSKEQKIKLYNQWQQGYSIAYLAKAHQLNSHSLSYLLQLLDCHGLQILDEPYHHYSQAFIEDALKQALTNKLSLNQLPIRLGLKSSGILFNWLRERQYY